MAWARVDDGWWCHPKVMALSLPARGLWISAVSWSCAQRRDVVPVAFLAMVGASEIEAKELESAGLWDDCPDGWQIHDWAHYQDRSTSEKRAEAGRKGGVASGVSRSKGEANEATDRSKGEAKAEAGPSRPVPTRVKELIPSPPTVDGTPPRYVKEAGSKRSSSSGDDGFGEWWGNYPRKVAKAEASKAWAKALRTNPKPTRETLATALRTQARNWQREGRQVDKIPHAATWLNGRRWEDDDLAGPSARNDDPAAGCW